MLLEQGHIILIPIPFTDLSSTKRRPVILISNSIYHRTTQDMVVVAMTSQPAQTAYSLTITDADLVEGTLNRPGQVRADKIYTLTQGLALRIFGKVQPSILERIRLLFNEIIHA